MQPHTDTETLLKPVLAPSVAHLGVHERNVVDNLALLADFGYASVTYARLVDDGLYVEAARRTTTAIGPQVKGRVATVLPRPRRIAGITPPPVADDATEYEAYEAVRRGATVRGTRVRTQRQPDGVTIVAYTTVATPVVSAATGNVCGVLIRDIAQAQYEAPGRMEAAFVQMNDELVDVLARRPLVTADGMPYTTVRRPGDGILRIDAQGTVTYPSPNAVAIMRAAGYESRVRTSHAAELPGGGYAIMQCVGRLVAGDAEMSVAGRTLLYRVIGLLDGAIVFVEDVTELRAEQQAVRVKDATIREVHHRVKNNLQTVAALLRMQARRTPSTEARLALEEATERLNSMAVVHELLSRSDFESLPLDEVARSVAESIARSMASRGDAIALHVEGEPGIQLPAATITSLAMVLNELLQNAYEHGFAVRTDESAAGTCNPAINVAVGRCADGISVVVADNGVGLPAGFSPRATESLGLSIVSTLVDDAGGTLRCETNTTCGHGARFVVTVPGDEV